MDPNSLQTFVDEVAAEMPAIRRGILVFAQHGGSVDELALSLELTRTIHSGASLLELPELETCASQLEGAITQLMNAETAPSSDATAAVLHIISGLEEAIVTVGMSLESSPLDAVAFGAEPMDVFESSDDDSWAEMSEDTAQEADNNSPGFDIDEELLEVFAMEAEGLLKSMHSSLEIMAGNPQDRNALWEVRRNAHTFKGAAGIVGFKKPSELAHRIEDLLDRIAECESFSTAAIVGTLSDSTACLEAMTQGDNSHQLNERIEEIYREFDAVLAAVSRPAEILLTVPEPAPQLASVELGAAAPDMQTTAPDAAIDSRRPPGRRQPIVRVSLSRLDELVRITRDLLIGRPVFEQRLKDMEQQIEELHNATRRLQTTSNRLEIDFEASMLSSGVGSRSLLSSGSVPRPSTAASFDDLELDRYTNFHQCTRQLSESASDTFEINNALDQVRGSFATLFDQQRKLIEEMQEKLMRIRMVEFGTLATRLQRVVTMTCEDEGKRARVVIENERTELDTQILDALTEPLLHLLKNAVVHGIESPESRRMVSKPEIGEIRLFVSHEHTEVVLKLSDDGRGIMPDALKRKAVEAGVLTREQAAKMSEQEAIELIFMRGLTTAEKLSLSAGRGVGMSIVKESIEAARGSISIASTPHEGTVFTIRLPVTLAISNVLLVKAGKQTIAIPAAALSRISDIPSGAVIVGDGGARTAITEAGEAALTSLSELIGHVPTHDGGNVTLLHARLAESERLVAVDAVMRTEEVVIKPLGRPLQNIKGVLGAALLGNGELVAIVDLPHLLTNKIEYPQITRATATEELSEMTVMIVDDSPSVRHMTSKIISNAGWLVMTAKDGIDALEQLTSCTQPPAVILSDIEMPRMNGYELIASLQRSEALCRIPVVMITSRSGSKHREKAFESGVAEYLSKPFDDQELVNAVRKLSRIV